MAKPLQLGIAGPYSTSYLCLIVIQDTNTKPKIQLYDETET